MIAFVCESEMLPRSCLTRQGSRQALSVANDVSGVCSK